MNEVEIIYLGYITAFTSMEYKFTLLCRANTRMEKVFKRLGKTYDKLGEAYSEVREVNNGLR